MNVKFLYWLVGLIGLVLLVGFAATLWIRNERLGQAVEVMAKTSEAQALRFNEALGRAEVKIDKTGALIEALGKNLPEEIRRDLDERNAEVVSIATATFRGSSGGGGRARVVSTSNQDGRSTEVRVSSTEAPVEVFTTKSKCEREYRWEFTDWRFNGSLEAFCGQEGKFDYKLNQQFEMIEATGSNDSRYIQLFEIGPDGKHYGPALKTESFNVVQRPKEIERFFWWAPHLDIAGSINHEREFGGEMAVSLMGYGKTGNDLSWRFLRGGAVYSSDIGAVLCPVSYNVGGPLPLLSNVWLSPCYQYVDDHAGSISIGAQL